MQSLGLGIWGVIVQQNPGGLGDLTYTASLFLSYPTKKVHSYCHTLPTVLDPQAAVPKSFTGCSVTVELGECR